MSDVSGNTAQPAKPKKSKKSKGAPIQRTKAQQAALDKAAAQRKAANDLANQQSAADAQAALVAQMANLIISGHTFAEIGAAIGATADEVEKILNAETARYVRTQPALRKWVRNWISGKYSEMIEANWDHAISPTSAERLENQDRVIKMLTAMERLHGAAAPTQSEVKVDATPELVQKVVDKLAAATGGGYDVDIFDVDEDDITGTIHDAPAEALAALEAAAAEADEPQPGETTWEGQ